MTGSRECRRHYTIYVLVRRLDALYGMFACRRFIDWPTNRKPAPVSVCRDLSWHARPFDSWITGSLDCRPRRHRRHIPCPMQPARLSVRPMYSSFPSSIQEVASNCTAVYRSDKRRQISCGRRPWRRKGAVVVMLGGGGFRAPAAGFDFVCAVDITGQQFYIVRRGIQTVDL